MNHHELYQQLILDHNKNPRQFGQLECPTHKADGVNPLCGDRYSVAVEVDETGVLKDIRFQGEGCAISKASASLMCEKVKGMQTDAVKILIDKFQTMIKGQVDGEDMGKLKVFANVSQYPARVKCAILAWHALNAALNNEQKVSTE
jgi:nitrogen fixation protein NifU and related proteins